MNEIQKENLREALVTVINCYNPEFVEQSEYGSSDLDVLIEHMEEFADECNQTDAKVEALKELDDEALKNHNPFK